MYFVEMHDSLKEVCYNMSETHFVSQELCKTIPLLVN